MRISGVEVLEYSRTIYKGAHQPPRLRSLARKRDLLASPPAAQALRMDRFLGDLAANEGLAAKRMRFTTREIVTIAVVDKNIGESSRDVFFYVDSDDLKTQFVMRYVVLAQEFSIGTVYEGDGSHSDILVFQNKGDVLVSFPFGTRDEKLTLFVIRTHH